MTTTFFRQISRMAFIAAAASLLGGCATSGNPKDPIEGFTRAMFGFNEGLDKAKDYGITLVSMKKDWKAVFDAAQG